MEGDPRETLQRDWASDLYYRGAGLRCGEKVRTEDLPSSGSVVDSGPVFSHKLDSRQGVRKWGSLGLKTG
jgi:hypothetical protein